MDVDLLKAGPGGVIKPSSPPRSSDSDWSDIDTEEEVVLSDDDEDIGDKLQIDIPKKKKRAINITESPDNTEVTSLNSTAKLQTNDG